jgi:hypothetical protein
MQLSTVYQRPILCTTAAPNIRSGPLFVLHDIPDEVAKGHELCSVSGSVCLLHKAMASEPNIAECTLLLFCLQFSATGRSSCIYTCSRQYRYNDHIHTSIRPVRLAPYHSHIYSKLTTCAFSWTAGLQTGVQKAHPRLRQSPRISSKLRTTGMTIAKPCGSVSISFYRFFTSN